MLQMENKPVQKDYRIKQEERSQITVFWLRFERIQIFITSLHIGVIITVQSYKIATNLNNNGCALILDFHCFF